MKRPTIANVKKLADDWFSLFVRLRGADYSGFVKCVTCGAKKHFRNIDAGHFQPRGNMATRFDERNVNPQDFLCNKVRQGEQVKHARYIDGRHGAGVSLELEVLAKSTRKMGLMDFVEIAIKYRRLAIIEAEKRGIQIVKSMGTKILDENA